MLAAKRGMTGDTSSHPLVVHQGAVHFEIFYLHGEWLKMILQNIIGYTGTKGTGFSL